MMLILSVIISKFYTLLLSSTEDIVTIQGKTIIVTRGPNRMYK